MSSFDLLKCTPEERKCILAKYDKTPENIREDVQTVKNWIKSQPHLPEVPEDGLIERFLLLNKFRIEIAKRKIDGYYSIRSLIPEFYDKDPNGEVIRELTKMIYYIPLPKLTEEHYRVVIVKPRKPITESIDAVTYMAHSLNMAELRVRHDYYHREAHIYDLEGVRITNMTKFTPSLIKKIGLVLEKVFTNSIGGLHFINVPNFVDSFIILLKNTLQPKVASRVNVHKGTESLYDMFSKDILPKDYGGTEMSLDELSEEWMKFFQNHVDLFEKLSKMRVNEELRQKPLFDEDELFGIQGNFKQLNVD